MPGAVIPTDVNAELVCYPVWWPEGGDWLAILLGQVSEPTNPLYWDKNQEGQEGASRAVFRAFYKTLDKIDVGGCFMVGEIKLWPSGVIPVGWLVCDGAVLGTVDYPELYDVVGDTYGSGFEVFQLPNLKGRVAIGRDVGQSEFDALGEMGGAKTHTLGVAQIPEHRHSLRVDTLGSAALTSGSGRLGGQGAPLGRRLTGTEEVSLSDAIDLSGGGAAHNNLQPYIVLNYIIYTGVVA